MEKIIKEGKELETILENLTNELNITKEELYYNTTSKKSGLFSKNTTIVVEAYTRSDLINYIKEYLKELINNLGIEANFESIYRDGTIFIKIHSNQNAILIGKGGNTIKSLEVILKQYLLSTLKDEEKAIFVKILDQLYMTSKMESRSGFPHLLPSEKSGK